MNTTSPYPLDHWGDPIRPRRQLSDEERNAIRDTIGCGGEKTALLNSTPVRLRSRRHSIPRGPGPRPMSWGRSSIAHPYPGGPPANAQDVS
jgi:hypothetical protein